MIARSDRIRERFDAILLDLDGTLLDPWSRITERSRRAVRALADVGLEVLICTGRSFTGTVPYAAELGLDTAVVAYNGAWIARPGDDPWRYATIPNDLLGEVVGVESRAPFAFRHHGERKVSLVREHPLYRRVADWYVDTDFVHDAAALPDRDLLRVSCYFDEPSACDEAWAAMGEEARRRLHLETFPMSIFREFSDCTLRLCEIQRRSRGKAEVYGYLAEEHRVPSSRVIAVGDHVNDLTMLEEAGLGVAMGNAVDSVKAVADVVIGDHEEDGIAAWVEAGMPGVNGS